MKCMCAQTRPRFILSSERVGVTGERGEFAEIKSRENSLSISCVIQNAR